MHAKVNTATDFAKQKVTGIKEAIEAIKGSRNDEAERCPASEININYLNSINYHESEHFNHNENGHKPNGSKQCIY